MLTCKRLTHLISEGLDRELPWQTRARMRIHLTICRSCRVFCAQMTALREALAGYRERAEETQAGEIRLDEAARRRLRERLDRERG